MIARVLSVLAALGLLGSAAASTSEKPVTKQGSTGAPVSRPVPSPQDCGTDGKPMPPVCP
jgi:hypothetical protein